MTNVSLEDYYYKFPDDDFLNYQNKISSFSKCQIESFIGLQKNKKKPLILLISGPSSTGKSSISIEIARLLGIRSIVSTDTVRLLISKNCPKKKKIAKYPSFRCWELIDSKVYSDENLIKGFHKQCAIMSDSIEEVCKNSILNVQNTIIEGVHLIPSFVHDLVNKYSAYFIPLFYNIEIEIFSKIISKRSISTYMNRSSDEYFNRIDKLIAYSEWWRNEIPAHGFDYILNATDPKEMLLKSIEKISLDIYGFVKNDQ